MCLSTIRNVLRVIFRCVHMETGRNDDEEEMSTDGSLELGAGKRGGAEKV